MSFVRLRKGSYVFYGMIQTDEEDGTIVVHIGSKRRPACVVIMIYPNDTTAILQSISYDERCASNQPMPRKTGTRAMLSVSFQWIKHQFPFITRISLTDEMSFDCQGKKVATGNMSFILHEKTWYEKHFNAYPANELNYAELKQMYRTKNLHESSFERIYKEIISLSSIKKKEAKQIYLKSTTWKEFYLAIYKHYQCDPFSIITVYKPFGLFYDKLSTLVSQIWYIRLDSLDPLDSIEIEPLQSTEFPEMDWKPLETTRKRFFGGLIKTRRFHKMYLGEGMEVL